MKRLAVNTIVEAQPKAIKLLFSHPQKRVHEGMIPILKEFLSRELGREVEIFSKYTAWETLYAATDNVFDLVILSKDYGGKDLSTCQLSHEIKTLDKSIPVIVFTDSGDHSVPEADACHKTPSCRQDLKPLREYFRSTLRIPPANK